jgi:hypothetical protein
MNDQQITELMKILRAILSELQDINVALSNH